MKCYVDYVDVIVVPLPNSKDGIMDMCTFQSSPVHSQLADHPI